MFALSLCPIRHPEELNLSPFLFTMVRRGFLAVFQLLTLDLLHELLHLKEYDPGKSQEFHLLSSRVFEVGHLFEIRLIL